MDNLIGSQNYLPSADFMLKDLGLLIINPEDIVRVFTARQFQILKAVIQGFTNKEIAEIHYIDEKTVKRHRQNIMNKVGISGRSEMRIFVRIIEKYIKNGTKSTIS